MKVKEEMKKKLPSLQTLNIGTNCYFWCNFENVVVFGSEGGSMKSTASKTSNFYTLLQKYLGKFVHLISLKKMKKIKWIRTFIPLLHPKKISRTFLDKHGRKIHPFGRLFRG